ncbi:patatin-like phospholipase family protein [Anaerosinus massiliensis]|uniref:patatin-like phospholipase family protein n=1 Tax=Massilibacillus massiliensis TaxID=1806837 RepID=UPI000DA60FCA|nr:patatin-like phospholipase family protein [Massilibacillus massiliensis]
MRPKIGLALGSGGLRGIAHVGVLKVFEKEGLSIDYIAGCSIGSLIGALYCSGHSADTILKLAQNLGRRHWLDFLVTRMGLFSGEKIIETMSLLTKKNCFSQLDIPLAVVATDLNTGQEVVFTEGLVSTAVRASVSVPGVFVPYALEDMLLVDGAVLNPTPIDVAFDMGADIVIAVDLAYTNSQSKINNIFDVILQSIDIMERELRKYRHKQDNVILIKPDVAHISPSSFDHIDECFLIGERSTYGILEELHKMIENQEY